VLTPIESDFETTEDADAYDAWFRAKVAASLAEPAPGVPHETVMAEVDAIVEAAEQKLRAG
jgi:hypothetical protein